MILQIEGGSYTDPGNYGGLFSEPPLFVVLHGSGLTVDATADNEVRFLRRPGIKVSYHFYVRESGLITQLVPLTHVAYHAGESTWTEGEVSWSRLNPYSLSIGLESNNLENEHYPAEQLGATLGLTRLLMELQSIPRERVLTHRQISYPRKADPVNFPLEAFISQL